MADRTFQALSYLTYWLDAVDEHSLHSPFFFDFYTKTIKARPLTPNTEFEKLREQLLRDQRPIRGKDLGARTSSSPRKVAEITSRSVSPWQLSRLYQRWIEYFNARSIVELGTSVGINTLYLAERKQVQVVTFEGMEEISALAELTFEFAGASNIRLIRGDLAQSLPSYLQTIRKLDFVLMDANHRYEPTLAYFEKIVTRVHEKSIVVMDDIHASAEMQRAWNHVKQSDLVYGSADLYRCGILFFDPSLNKQHVILQL